MEDYLPFLISEIYLQDMGLLSYPHHRPLEQVNWVFPFWTDARGQDALLGLPLFGAQWMGLRTAPIFKPHQLPPTDDAFFNRNWAGRVGVVGLDQDC